MRPAEPRVAGRQAQNPPTRHWGRPLFIPCRLPVGGTAPHRGLQEYCHGAGTEGIGSCSRLLLDGACSGWKSSSSILWDQIEELNADKMGTHTE